MYTDMRITLNAMRVYQRYSCTVRTLHETIYHFIYTI